MIDYSEFYVIAVLSNPIRFHARYKLFKDFMKHMNDVHANVLIVEQAFGARTHELTKEDNVWHLRIRADFNQEIWLKENMINIGIQHLSKINPNWKYVAWIDGDIHFQRHDIIEETVHQLQHYQVVQMFAQCIDMGPQQNPIQTHNSFMWSYVMNDRNPPQGSGHNGYYTTTKGFWHPGYAWAARRDAIEKVPLLDFAILGAADHHMALGLIGCADRSVPGKISQPYKDMVINWQNQADYWLRRNCGYVPGAIVHGWHGNKVNRKYQERWDILTKNHFDPTLDISRDPQGLYRLNEHRPHYVRLRDDIRAYFRQRNEDSVDDYNDLEPMFEAKFQTKYGIVKPPKN